AAAGIGATTNCPLALPVAVQLEHRVPRAVRVSRRGTIVVMVGFAAQPAGEGDVVARAVAEPRILSAFRRDGVEEARVERRRFAETPGQREAEHRVPGPRAGLVLGFEPLALTVDPARLAGRRLDAE